MNDSECKVVHFTEAFEGGIATFLRHVLPLQVGMGLDVTLICSMRSPALYLSDLTAIQSAGVKVQIMSLTAGVQPIRDAKAIIRLRNILRHESTDVLHTHCFKAGLLGRIASLGVRARTIHSPHCFPFLRVGSPFLGRILLSLERKLARITDHFIFVSCSERDLALLNGITDESRATVIRNGIPNQNGPMRPRSSSKRLSERPVIGTFCRLVGYKGIDHLLAACRLLNARKRPVRCLIVGEGREWYRLMNMAQSFGLSGMVEFLGFRRDVRAIQDTLDCVVLCSKTEAMPYALLEAMAAGVPVIASAVPGNTDLINDGNTGLLVPYGRPDILADAIDRLLSDSSLGDLLCRKAHEFINVNHDLGSQVRAMCIVYNHLLKHENIDASESHKNILAIEDEVPRAFAEDIKYH